VGTHYCYDEGEVALPCLACGDEPMSNLISARDSWLKEENPDLYSILLALDGDADALLWLKNKSLGLWTFSRALAGDKLALAELSTLDEQEREYLQGTIALCGQLQWLAERSPVLALLFEAVKGDEPSLKRLKRKKAALARLAGHLRDLFEETAPVEPGEVNGEPAFTEGASADVGILVGEQHLRQGEFTLAVEAFSRALETSPSPDAYEGRARAYQALAQQDERRAEELREYDARGGLTN
jgi:tetratricopeptide (TPR) repeat protein